MTDTKQAAAPAEASQLMDIGTVAAHNIAASLGQGEDKVVLIRDAIRDEISAMSSHFSLAIADVQTQYEAEVLKAKKDYAAAVAAVKADYSFLVEHKIAVGAALAVTFGLGVLVRALI